jgi:NADH-quinone oxidoreductase subunit J
VLNVAYGMLVIILMTSAVIAVLSKNLIRAAVALGVGSAALAMIFFMLGAPYAGGFELSVGAGLISVLFIIGISLTQAADETHVLEGGKPYES